MAAETGDDLLVLPAELAHGLGEYFGVARRAGRFFPEHPRFGIELRHPVIGDGLFFAMRITVALLRNNVDQIRTLHLHDVPKGRDEQVEAVAIHRADVAEAEFLEQNTGDEEVLDGVLDLVHERHGGIAQREVRHDFLDFVAHPSGPVGPLARHDAGEVGAHRAHVSRNTHLVIVQDDGDVTLHIARVIQAFHRHSGGETTIADNCDHVVVFAVEDRARWPCPARRKLRCRRGRR